MTAQEVMQQIQPEETENEVRTVVQASSDVVMTEEPAPADSI